MSSLSPLPDISSSSPSFELPFLSDGSLYQLPPVALQPQADVFSTFDLALDFSVLARSARKELFFPVESLLSQ